MGPFAMWLDFHGAAAPHHPVFRRLRRLWNRDARMPHVITSAVFSCCQCIAFSILLSLQSTSVAAQTERVRALLSDPERTSYVGVAQPTEMAVTETLELQQGLERLLGRGLDAVIVNGVLPRRFSEPELLRAERLEDATARSAAKAARAVHERARVQHNQLARLRRRRFEVLVVPFQFVPELDLDALRKIADLLARKL